MAKEKFKDVRLTGLVNVACKFDDGTTRNWVTDKTDVIKNIIRIVNEYMADGYILTLRQLHYQFVATVPGYVNHDTAYKKLGSILDDCRYSGFIDWLAIEDRGRVPHLLYSCDDVADALSDTVDQYRLDRQRGQSNHVELWTEKDALSGILSTSTEKYHIQLVVNKGYTSSSAAYRAYKRILYAITTGKKATILYFGDHDPSGLDMIRDIKDRLEYFLCHGSELNRSDIVDQWWDEKDYSIYDVIEFTQNDNLGRMMDDDPTPKLAEEYEASRIAMWLDETKSFRVVPIGLTMAQIKQYKLPPNPTKMTDSRSDKYVSKYGKTCWEVDALRPQVLISIIEKHIQQEIDVPLYNKVLNEESKDIKELTRLVKQYKSE